MALPNCIDGLVHKLLNRTHKARRIGYAGDARSILRARRSDRAAEAISFEQKWRATLDEDDDYVFAITL